MKLEVYLHRVVPILAILAALGPSVTVGKLIKASEFTKTFTQYGPLPDVELLMIDYATIVFAAGLFVAAVLEAFRLRIAAPAVLVAVIVLWIHYVPSIADEITGTMWFATKLHRSIGLTWQSLTFQTATMLSSAVLTYLRFIRSPQ